MITLASAILALLVIPAGAFDRTSNIASVWTLQDVAKRKSDIQSRPYLTFNDPSHLGIALLATDALIAMHDKKEAAANGWFNRGLVCEKIAGNWLYYNGTSYCTEGPLYPYLRAWALWPSNAARLKVKELFTSGRDGLCPERMNKRSTRTYFAVVSRGEDAGQSGQKQKIYAYHASDDAIDPGKLSWTHFQYRDNERTTTTVTPRIVERVDLNGFAVTVLEADSFVPIDDGVCALFLKWGGDP